MTERLAGLKAELEAAERPPAKAATLPADRPAPGRAQARVGKHSLIGYFSPELCRSLKVMAAEEGTTIQALLGEAIDTLMRQRGRHPFGER